MNGDMFATYVSSVGFVANLVIQLFGLGFTGLLIRQHSELVYRNYSTNEGINWRKYSWFLREDADGNQEFHNPFDRGILNNLVEFWTRPPADKRRQYLKTGGYRLVPRI
jgi:hypothetical protein